MFSWRSQPFAKLLCEILYYRSVGQSFRCWGHRFSLRLSLYGVDLCRFSSMVPGLGLCVFGSTSNAFLPWMMLMVDLLYGSPGFVNSVAHLQSNGVFYPSVFLVFLSKANVNSNCILKQDNEM
jgi:hypothetical protein